ncbi:MAG: hypothetical protein M3Y31_09095, partial [Gemmatimonadota bacterium]|nr:hypothetical protein [Gemmatimonadota bacterium]
TRTASAGTAHEAAADQSAKGWLGRLWGLAANVTRPTTVTAGLQLQRCKGDSASLSQLGVEEKDSDVGFVTTPAMQKRDGQWFAVLGQKVTFRAAHASHNKVTAISRMFYSKLEGDRATALEYTNRREVEFDSAGTWVVWAGGRSDGIGFSIHRRIEVIDPADYAKQAAQVQVGTQGVPATTRGVTSYLRMQIAMQERMTAQFGAVPTQYEAGPYIESDAPNPVSTKERTIRYRAKHVPGNAARFRWQREHEGAPKYQDPAGQHLWTELGTTTVPEKEVTSFLYGAGAYDYACTILDADGNDLGTATYRQMVAFDKEMKVANQWTSYLTSSKQLYDKLKSPMQVPGAFVNGETGEAMPLYMFVGESATNAGTWLVLDLTPDASKGDGPKAHEFAGTSIESALGGFKAHAAERYPKGKLHLMTSILPGQRGDMAFSGGKQSWLKDLADWLGLASIGWTLAGFTAAIFGAAPLAMAFFGLAAGTGALSSAASIADRIRRGDADATGYFIDIAGFAVSAIGVGQAATGYKNAVAAAKAAKSGTTAEVVISTTGRKFVQWTEQRLVQSTAILITVESIAQIEEIANSSLSNEEKAARIAGLLRQITLQAGIYSVSRKATLPAALEQRASRLAAVERQALNTLDDRALAQLAKMPDDVRPVIALALDHPVEVNKALGSGKVTSIADLEVAVKPTPTVDVPTPPPVQDVVAPPVKEAPPVKDVVPPPKDTVPPSKDVVPPPKDTVPPSKDVVPPPKDVLQPLPEPAPRKPPVAVVSVAGVVVGTRKPVAPGARAYGNEPSPPPPVNNPTGTPHVTYITPPVKPTPPVVHGTKPPVVVTKPPVVET